MGNITITLRKEGTKAQADSLKSTLESEHSDCEINGNYQETLE